MPPFKPIKRQELIRQLKKLGFSEPKAGGNHQYMVKGIWLKVNLSCLYPTPIEEISAKVYSLAFYARQIFRGKNGKIFKQKSDRTLQEDGVYFSVNYSPF